MKEIWEGRKSGAKGDLAIAVKGSPASAGRIATVPHYEGRDARQIKIAHLISAAPELYETLTAWVDWFNAGRDPYNVSFVGLLDETASALRKARGVS